MSVIITYLNDNAETPLRRFVVYMLYSQLCNKFCVNRFRGFGALTPSVLLRVGWLLYVLHWEASFVLLVVAVDNLSMCLQPPPALRPRPGPVCYSPLTLGLVCIFIEPSIAGGFLWQGANVRSSCKTAGPCHLLSAPAALTTPRLPQSGCVGLSHLKEDTGKPSVPAREFNLIACRNLTWHASSSGRRTHTLPN